MLTAQEAQELGDAITKLIAERGLASISKKDWDLPIFHHLIKSNSLRDDDNYHLANSLKVTEARIKSLRLESSIRHSPANHKAVLGRITQRIISELSKPEFSGQEVSISLEDPVDRRELEYALKRLRHNVEYGMNREIFKISPLALFEVILENVEKAEERFKEIVQECIKKKSRQEDILQKSITFRQKINKLGEQITKDGAAVAMLTAAAGML